MNLVCNLMKMLKIHITILLISMRALYGVHVLNLIEMFHNF